MKRKNLLLILISICMLLLTSCGSRPEDRENKNITEKSIANEISGCDIYYNIGNNMSEYLDIDSKSYTEIVYAAASVARSIWHSGDNKFYTVTDTLKEEDISFLSFGIEDSSKYSELYNNTLKPALSNVSNERMTLIITDLQSDLYDYSSVSELFVKNVLEKNLSIGFIGVQLDIDDENARTFFIIAISDSVNLSKYISEFKNNPTIVSYSGEQTDFQKDTIEMINYQIIANESGIQGLNYENIEFIENGFYAGPDGNISVQESRGSFINPNIEYTQENMIKDIEGTVNFTPNTQRFVNVRKPKGGNTPVYLGVKSLIYERKNNETGKEISGKIKLNVPFNVINGVKLSKIQCDLETNVYTSKSGKFSKSPVDSNIYAVLADGATPEQGKWRIDDKTNSAVLNIMIPEAGNLPIDKGAVKLDITFKQNDTIESVSNWVKNWDERGCKNILNLFNSLYTYQKDANIAENTLTVYIAPGEEKFTRRVQQTNERRNKNE